MLLPGKDGIKCDLCGAIYKDQFVYYSASFTSISVDSAVYAVTKGQVELDLDICQKCYDGMLDVVREHLKTPSIGQIKCDLCDGMYSGKFIWYDVGFTKVEVDRSSDDDNSGISAVDERFMDLRIVDKCCMNGIREKVKIQQEIVERGVWS